ncbi:hypothetical protein THASP1DRAFT_33249 [Thamnocephalis sphaerospora]|uniref:Uncharacterized protein n=1 Tax=Thamnocephalis sphaerospora TaxID=78915 RepID=A0A4V1IVR0_9FUNG|nr:hypothetical protein THASP1DRAFT_33249 [Thamnocephalis sphaerospora]|eukprot:RKP04929.1 hypothetical protein THASP1DRAFT_33249 [Thamnocephalis sphaerospora]
MHSALLFRTTLAIFAGLSLAGSLTNALSVPPITASQLMPMMQLATGMVEMRQTPVSLSTVKAFLDDRSNHHVQTIPYFAFYQPEGTQPVYRKDDKGRTIEINFLDAGKNAVRKLDVKWIADTNKISNAAIGDAPFKSHPDTSVSTDFKGSSGGPRRYVIATAHGLTKIKTEHASDYTNMIVKVSPSQMNFALEKILPWDGTSLPLTPGPKVAGA